MDKPIGIFDSGIGGISILNELTNELTKENFVYLSDNLNCPYGNKSVQEIINLSLKNCHKLVELNCKMIVVACNTSTTNSISILRNNIDIPIIGVEPGIKPAINYTKTNNIGVLATEKTLGSKLFFNTSKNNNITNIKIHEQVGYMLVEKIEKGLINNKSVEGYLKKYFSKMLKNNIDCLVLGCTHYNFLINQIKKIMPENIKLIDTITPIITHIKKTISKYKIASNSNYNGVIKVFYNGKTLNKEFLKKRYLIEYLDF